VFIEQTQLSIVHSLHVLKEMEIFSKIRTPASMYIHTYERFSGPMQIYACMYMSRAGWPDWTNFRLLGDCFLCFLRFSEVAHIFGPFSTDKSYLLIYLLKWVGLHFGPFTNKLIWSPWSWAKFIRMKWNTELVWLLGKNEKSQDLFRKEHTDIK
jgi:hypothetical protein